MKVISSLIYGLALVLVVAVAGLFLVSALPIPGNIEVKVVKSGSMEPTIQTGSIVVVRPEPAYFVGDIVTFGPDTRERIPTTHRIVDEVVSDQGAPGFITKGDNNEDVDAQPVVAGSIIGRVVLSIPYAGYVLDFAKQPIGFVFLIGIPAAIIMIDEGIKLIRDIRAYRRRKNLPPAL
ncbi:MAG: signal peptidase I [Patescibacteria group bacterium]